MEELKKVKVEETIKADISRSEILLIYPSLNIDEPSVSIINWSSISPMSPFSLGLFIDLKISDIIETSLNIRLNS